jgi:hypothetical protein
VERARRGANDSFTACGAAASIDEASFCVQP